MSSIVHKHDLATIFRHFDSRADYVAGLPYGTGHINDTFRISASQGGHKVFFTLQHVNTRIFKDGPGLMSNITRISQHAVSRLRAEGATDASRRALQVVPAIDGRPFHIDGAGMLWRMYVFIDGVRTHDKVEQPRHAFEAARSFGLFQRLLADLPGARLNETIVNFHHTRSRFETFRQALQQDACGRAARVRREIDFVQAREPLCDVLLNLMASGEIPERVTHNDTKINNVLMDEQTDEGMCVIDLDTCMPGCALYDFGDMVRSATNSTAEDDPDASRVHCQVEIFEALARGYLGAADFLTPAERAHLVTGGKLMTLECGIRFLTDYLQGDVYFKTHRDGQNLDRCRTQFALVKSIEDHAGEMQKFVDSLTP
jgi:hypothetical protein